MIQTRLKLRLNAIQENRLENWLYHLSSIWNWGVRQIEINAGDNIYFSRYKFKNLLAGHSKKIEVPSHIMQGTLIDVHNSWRRCFDGISNKPRLKGARNKLNSISFVDSIGRPNGNRIGLLGLGKVRFHKMAIPDGKIKCGRIVKRASGWHLCLVIDVEREQIARRGSGIIGIDSGFKSLLSISNGEKVEHPRELEASAKRLAQAQRGRNKKLTARINEYIAHQKLDRNHKLSRRLISENVFIAFTKDNIKGIAKRFGKSVASSGHYQLRKMLSYKSRAGGTKYVEVDGKFSTMTCSECGSLSGPTGFAG
jgi:putative transposase